MDATEAQIGCRSNIGKFYLATALAAFAFYTPIAQLFYMDRGLTIFGISILGVIWTTFKMLFEIPSSILADKWGRKKVMMLSSFFGIMQIIVLMISRNFYFFALASVLSALSAAFLSGTDVAFFYDSLKNKGKETEFEKLWARQQIYSQVPFAIAFSLSGFLYHYSLLLPYQLALGFSVLAFLVMITFTEPKISRPLDVEMKFLKHFGSSMKCIWKSQELRFILIFAIIFSLGSNISYGFGQIYLKNLALPVVLFGVVFTAKSFLCTLGANLVPKLRKKITIQKIFGVEILSLTILFYLSVIAKSYWFGALCFILIAIPHGLYEITKSSFIHQHIESHERATIDSLFSFLAAMLFLVIEPTVGWLADKYSIKFPFLLIAIILTIYSGYYFIRGYKEITK